MSATAVVRTVLAFLGLASSLFVAKGWFDFADCVPFLVLGPSIPMGLVTLASGMGFLRTAKQNLEHIARVLSAEQLPETEKAERLPGSDLDVAFDETSFSYGESTRLALDHVSACIAPGTICALVGDSGSGKTTFARLIPRFWDPTSGSVRLGGHDLRDVSSQSLLSQVAIVFQESMLLSLSIRDNIKLSCPDATDDEMIEAAKAAQIHERILSFVGGAMILSIFGSWINYTYGTTESLQTLSEHGLLTERWGRKNAHGVASFSLLITTVLCQLLLITMHFTEDAYNFGFSLSGSAILVTWTFIVLYNFVRAVKNPHEKGRTKNLVIGGIGTLYMLYAMMVSGFAYILLLSIPFAIGLGFYFNARKKAGDEHVFSAKEKIVVAAVVLVAIGSAIAYAAGLV